MKTTINDIRKISMEILNKGSIFDFKYMVYDMEESNESNEPILNHMEMYYNKLKHSDIKNNYVKINKIGFKATKYINIRNNI